MVFDSDGSIGLELISVVLMDDYILVDEYVKEDKEEGKIQRIVPTCHWRENVEIMRNTRAIFIHQLKRANSFARITRENNISLYITISEIRCISVCTTYLRRKFDENMA